MHKTNKKIIFWINDTDTILKGEMPQYGIGGANVQMALWAKKFSDKGWRTYSFTRNKIRSKNIHNIRYVYFPIIRYVGFLLCNFLCLYNIIKIRPNYVVTRAHINELPLLIFLGKIFNYNIVHMLASDADVKINKKLNSYQRQLKKINFVITQNVFQASQYKINIRNLETKTISNIWENIFDDDKIMNILYDVIWVANFRKIKRPDWLLQIAKELPQFRFAMIGLPLDVKCYNSCILNAQNIPNVSILGYKSLLETNNTISASKLLICTSEFEGFPNTFLQAWSYNKPVISTVNPSNVITENNIGIYSPEIKGLTIGIDYLLRSEDKYQESQQSIREYFNKNHCSDKGYKIFHDYICNN